MAVILTCELNYNDFKIVLWAICAILISYFIDHTGLDYKHICPSSTELLPLLSVYCPVYKADKVDVGLVTVLLITKSLRPRTFPRRSQIRSDLIRFDKKDRHNNLYVQTDHKAKVVIKISCIQQLK